MREDELIDWQCLIDPYLFWRRDLGPEDATTSPRPIEWTRRLKCLPHGTNGGSQHNVLALNRVHVFQYRP